MARAGVKHTQFVPWRAFVVLVLGVTLVYLFGLAASARAGTVTVTSTSDSGPGSLRQVVGEAAAGDTVTFDPGLGPAINLTTGAITIDKSLTIEGPGASLLTVDAGHNSQIFIVTAGDLSISSLSLANGAAPGSGTVSGIGGAIEETGAGSLSVSNCNFTGNTAGGPGGSAELSNRGHGGAIYVSPLSGSTSISDSTFNANAAGGSGGTGAESGLGSGGAIWDAGESLTVSGSQFTGNTAGGNGDGGEESGNGAGGAIQKSGGLSLIVANSEFTDNTAGGIGGSEKNSGHGHGGAIYVSQPSSVPPSLTVSGSTFTGNSAGGPGGDGPISGVGEGGAIEHYSEGPVVVSDSTFAENRAGGAGGAGGPLGFGLFAGSGAGRGGAIIVDELAASASVSGSVFTANTAGGDGGSGNLSGRGEGAAIKGESGTGPVTVTDSTFTDNVAGGRDGTGSGSGAGAGGAIESFSSLTITSSAFTNNAAGGQGGSGEGAFGHGGAIDNFNNVSPLTIVGSTFTGNTAGGQGGTGSGGAINASAVAAGRVISITNSTLVGNAAGGGGANGHGGAIEATDLSSLILASVTISGNSVGGSGGSGAGINSATGALSRAAAVTARTTIVSGNTGATNCDAHVTTSSYSLEGPSSSDTSCGFDLPSADPQLEPLADNGGSTETQGLPPTSPAVDAVPVAKCPTKVDQRGEPRPDNGESFCDVGAFEFQDPPVAPTITSGAATTFQVGKTRAFTVTATGVPPPDLTQTGGLPSGVTFTDNGNGTASLSGRPGPGTGGSYPITFKASNGVSPDATQSFTLTVQAPPTVTIATPAGGGTYKVGRVVNTRFACVEGAGGPGLASCTDQDGHRSGTVLDTSTPGSHTFTVTAISKDGLSGSESIRYRVIQAPEPRLTLTLAPHTERLRRLLRTRKLVIATGVSEAANVVLTGKAKLKVYARRKTRTTLVTVFKRKTVPFAAAGEEKVALALTRKGRRALRHLHKVRLVIAGEATDAAGKTATESVPLTLWR